MGTYILRRLLLTIVIVWGALSLLFLLFQGIPGNSIESRYNDRYLQPTIKKNFEREYGLDKPVVVQYAKYWVRFVQGDLGRLQDGLRLPVRARFREEAAPQPKSGRQGEREQTPG